MINETIEILYINQLNLNVLSSIFILIASFFYITSVIGLIRLPGVMNKLHATGLSDITALFFLISGSVIHCGFTMFSLKLVFLFLLSFFASPIVGNKIANTAYYFDKEQIIYEED